MRNIFKLGLISVFVLAFFVIGISFLIPSTTRVSRALDMNVKADSIMTLVKSLDKWKEWNLLLQDEQWSEMESTPVSIKSSAWNVMLVKKDQNLVKTVWTNPSGQVVESGIELHSGADGVTVVQWYFEFKVRWYPWEKFASILFDRQVGPIMERSLEKIRQHFREG